MNAFFFAFSFVDSKKVPIFENVFEFFLKKCEQILF